jgi:hypothetical protein
LAAELFCQGSLAEADACTLGIAQDVGSGLEELPVLLAEPGGKRSRRLDIDGMLAWQEAEQRERGDGLGRSGQRDFRFSDEGGFRLRGHSHGGRFRESGRDDAGRQVAAEAAPGWCQAECEAFVQGCLPAP